MIEVDQLSKRYGRGRKAVDAVRGVTFSCAPGEIFGLLGPNGAGKTTTLRMIATMLQPTGGTIHVQGFDSVRQAGNVRQNIGFLSASTGLYARLKPLELLRFFGRLYGMENTALEARIDELVAMLELDEFCGRPCDKLSTGQKQRVSIARTVVHDPPVMIFDEPTAGLDILSGRSIVQFIRRCRDAGKTVILSTHIMAEVDKLCDRVGLIHQGKLLECDTLAAIRGRWDTDLEEAFLKMVAEHPELTVEAQA